jgi:hypothetical protein
MIYTPPSVELPPGSGNSIVSGDRRKRKEGRRMAEEKRTETMIAQGDSEEAVEVMGFMEMLDNHEKKEFLAFLQGARFMKNLSAGAIRTA